MRYFKWRKIINCLKRVLYKIFSQRKTKNQNFYQNYFEKEKKKKKKNAQQTFLLTEPFLVTWGMGMFLGEHIL